MRFKDIPPFTRSADYRVNVGLDFLQESLRGYLEQGLDMDPDFQRAHVWTEEQQVRFVEYLLRDGVSGRVIYFNHPGWMGDWKGAFVLVDGKQRLEACLKFLRGDLRVFGHIRPEFKDRISFSIGLVFAVNNLKTRAEVLQWYLDLNTGGTVHTDVEIDKVRRLLEGEPTVSQPPPSRRRAR
jgi:hypothetical protein